MNKEGTFKNINPKKDYAANGSKATWVLMDKVRYSFVEILMANFAKLASAVFYGQYMFSQYGIKADGSAVETVGGYKDFNYNDPMNPANKFRPNLLLVQYVILPLTQHHGCGQWGTGIGYGCRVLPGRIDQRTDRSLLEILHFSRLACQRFLCHIMLP